MIPNYIDTYEVKYQRRDEDTEKIIGRAVDSGPVLALKSLQFEPSGYPNTFVFIEYASPRPINILAERCSLIHKYSRKGLD